MKKSTSQEAVTSVETLVVGAGPSGLLAARQLQSAHPEMQILVLEAEDRTGGRTVAGCHLLDASLSRRFPVLASKEFAPARVRWDRNWIAPEDVKWTDKTWIGQLPQWKSYLRGEKRLLKGLGESDIEVAVKTRSPVRALTRVDDVAGPSRWKLETPDHTYLAQRIVWAAGLTAFQNAFGKHESQDFLVGNPSYQKEAADFVGGISLDLHFKKAPSFETGFDANAVFALPLRHNGALYLILGVVDSDVDGGAHVYALAHAHLDVMSDPKEVLSLQKSMRRTLRMILANDSKATVEVEAAPASAGHPLETQLSLGASAQEAAPAAQAVVGPTERWCVSSKVGGHLLGSMWVFGAGIDGSLEFVGDETLAAAQDSATDSVAALASVASLSQLKRGHEDIGVTPSF